MTTSIQPRKWAEKDVPLELFEDPYDASKPGSITIERYVKQLGLPGM